MSDNEPKLYKRRGIVELDKAGEFYMRHVSAMTGEGLHQKSDIAAELGYRDMRIDILEKLLEKESFALVQKMRSMSVTELREVKRD